MSEELEIHDIRRLVVREGEILAVIAPAWVQTAETVARFQRLLTETLEPLGVRALIFPHGTDLAVVADSSQS